jgi:hypothetical protein
MPRPDLLALTDDDLAALTNKGTVKRARRDLEAGECTGEVVEDDTGLTARWSDGVECHVPARGALRDGRCSCQALGTCRHLVRTVLAYQRQQSAGSEGEAAVRPSEPWDPGAMTDEELAKHFKPAAWAKIQERFREGVLVELLRSAKPMARFHLPACTVRFLVPGDPRYCRCDCAETAPCQHVPLAVWAFRQLPQDQQAGILANGAPAAAPPAELLDSLEAICRELVEQGVSGAPAGWLDRLTRLERQCEEAALIWPADVLGELAAQQHRYAEHDARFLPERVADLAGELLLRADAIRADTGALPQPLIRGTSSDRPVELGASQLVGLGCIAVPARRSVELVVYLQDIKSGSVVALARDYADHNEPDRPQRAFADLAMGTPFPGGSSKGLSFAALGGGQLLLRGGKRLASFHLQPGRAAASIQPQAFAWEDLQAPTLVGEFAELEARLNSLPPSVLRPRRVAEDFHACAVAGAEFAHFDHPTQTILAVLVDSRGNRALLSHPYTTRGRAGAEALLARLTSSPEKLKFVSGSVRRTPRGLVIHPACLVWQEDNGRTALQPWIDRSASGGEAEEARPEGAIAQDPLAEYLHQLQAALAEVVVLGLQRADALVTRRWRELHRRGEAVGLVRLGQRVGKVATTLEQKAHALDWDLGGASASVLELLVLVRLAVDLTAE